MFSFSNVIFGTQLNPRKIESDIEFSRRRDQVTFRVYSPNKGYICVKMMARHGVFDFVSLLSFFVKFDKQCANSTQGSQSPN